MELNEQTEFSLPSCCLKMLKELRVNTLKMRKMLNLLMIFVNFVRWVYHTAFTKLSLLIKGFHI